jgi:hypothetical protein
MSRWLSLDHEPPQLRQFQAVLAPAPYENHRANRSRGVAGRNA